MNCLMKVWSYRPVILVGNDLRLCVDFTLLNKITKKDAYPIQQIEDIFYQLLGASILSSLDLKASFCKLMLHLEDQEKITFICHLGLFHFRRMLMGLSNTNQQFQRTIEVALHGLIGISIIKDVWSSSISEHLH